MLYFTTGVADFCVWVAVFIKLGMVFLSGKFASPPYGIFLLLKGLELRAESEEWKLFSLRVNIPKLLLEDLA